MKRSPVYLVIQTLDLSGPSSAGPELLSSVTVKLPRSASGRTPVAHAGVHTVREVELRVSLATQPRLPPPPPTQLCLRLPCGCVLNRSA
jgi:hypothetical protein